MSDDIWALSVRFYRRPSDGHPMVHIHIGGAWILGAVFAISLLMVAP